MQIDVDELMKEVYKLLCDDCRKKIGKLNVPLKQTVTVKDLFLKK